MRPVLRCSSALATQPAARAIANACVKASRGKPTASLDTANRAVVVELIDEKKRHGVALVAIVHDDEIRHLIADRIVDVTSFAAAA